MMPTHLTPTITITLRVRGSGTDDYGIATVTIPCSAIDWSLADAPRDRITLDDIYQVDLDVGRPGETRGTDTWDRS
jgi:hypothetical protein